MVHAVVDGLLYVAKNDAVYETTLRFCAKAKCVTDIRSKMNNIRNLASMEVQVDGSLILTEEERADLMQEGFVLLDVWFTVNAPFFLDPLCQLTAAPSDF